MASDLKIVAIGMGTSFGRGIVSEVLQTKEFDDLNAKLVLVDIDEGALERMYRFAVLVKEHCGSKVQVEMTTDGRAALAGAKYVFTAFAIKRYPLWEQDFRIPLAYGFKHVLGENGGPGAAFHALRNLAVMIPICRDMEELCPDALLLNYTNPESRIVRAVSDLTRIRAVGLCHGVFGAIDGIKRILGRSREELEIICGGLNHFFWVMKIADKKTGEDLYPELLSRILNDPECPSAPPLVKKMVEVFGCYTYPSDDHIGEYLSFGYEFMEGVKWPYGQEARPVPREEPAPEPSRLEQYVSGERKLEEGLRDSGELGVPIVRAIELKELLWADAVNVPNSGGYVGELSAETVVEVPAKVDGEGVHPRSVPPVPEALAAFCRTQASIQKLVVEAYGEHSKRKLLQALLLDPVVNSVGNAERMLDDMLELQREYLPELE
jgi:alpha-galactosidase